MALRELTKKPRKKHRRRSYTVGESGPRPVDVHVGGRVKARRTSIGMSQKEFGKHVGLTAQQISKYEKGMTRIAASRLWVISRVLGQPISWFFEGIGKQKRKGDDLLAKRETLQLVRYLSACDPDVQKHLAAMINAVAGKAK
ncbi:MAG: helix-turn-helix transcriptional regulator [Proteobacteria bacterium]|nr:helix-turn-helix transcriptional regulator [Pseudomonadota bacterium]